MKVVVIVPAFNESPVIYKVIKSIPKKFKGVTHSEIILINDGSNDDTNSEAKRAGAEIISHILNRGLGAAIKTGLEIARQKNADIAVTFDGDGQHNPNDIQKIIKPILSKNADFVVGSRFKKKQKVPLDRFILNWIANLITFIFYGALSTDSQSGFRAFSKKAINLIDFKADRMEFSSEVLLEAKRNNLQIKEVPIKAKYTNYSREKGQKNTNAFPVFSRLVIKLFK